jgi:hypothetical protein
MHFASVYCNGAPTVSPAEMPHRLNRIASLQTAHIGSIAPRAE